jgi:hypothetical protein
LIGTKRKYRFPAAGVKFQLWPGAVEHVTGTWLV